jgi:hypothetical protein
MADPGSGRGAVISADMAKRLKLYLQFRHLFRSAYVFSLQWEKISPLVAELENDASTVQVRVEDIPGPFGGTWRLNHAASVGRLQHL